MHRPTFLIASRHPTTAVSLRAYFELLLPQGDLTHRIEHVGSTTSAELFRWLDTYPPEELGDLFVLLDLGAESGDPWDVANMDGDKGLAAQLVLSYPEVYFVFVGASGTLRRPAMDEPPPEWWAVAEQHHFVPGQELIKILSLLRLHVQGFRTMFDATGLRSYLKDRLHEQVLKGLPEVRACVYQPISQSRLRHAAASADEEAWFLYLNGYAAYKYGFRCWLAYTKEEFWRLLAESHADGTGIPAPGRFRTALVDWHLAYRDDDGSGTPLVNRANAFRKEKVEQPIVITSFPEEVSPSATAPATTQDWPRRTLILMKPYGGLFSLLDHAPAEGPNPVREVFSAALDEVDNVLKAPPVPAGDRTVPHGAPYACSIVANSLLFRARELLARQPFKTETWVQIALLAGEVKEILGGLSRTTAYEAIALQNAAEVQAEVSFYGQGMRIEVRQRLLHLEREAIIVEQSGTTAKRQVRRADVEARLTFLRQAANKLRLGFAEHEQMGASEECLCKVADYQSHLDRLQIPPMFPPVLKLVPLRDALRRIRNVLNQPLPWLQWVGSWYIDRATRAGTSVSRLICVSAGWVFGFGLLYFLLLQGCPEVVNNNALNRSLSLSLWHSCLTFVLQPSISLIEQRPEQYLSLKSSFWYCTSLFLELCIAYLHLGLLVAVLYRHLTKRAP